MSIYRVTVQDTLVILNAIELKTWFGLDEDEIPMIFGGFMTAGAAQVSMVLAIDKNITANHGIATGADLLAIGQKNIGGQIANEDSFNILAASDFAQTPIPIINPIPVMAQIAIITNDSSSSILNLDVVAVEGSLREQSKHESLAERHRMQIESVGGEIFHVMNRPRIMGDAEPGAIGV